MTDPHHLIFLCVANSARSQLAEGLARASAPPGWIVSSAGSQPGNLHPLSTRVMAEIGIDISGHRSKGVGVGVDQVPVDAADIVVTLCAEEVCPVTPPQVERLHWPISDPAAAGGGGGGGDGGEEQLEAFRAARTDLQQRIEDLWDSLRSTAGR